MNKKTILFVLLPRSKAYKIPFDALAEVLATKYFIKTIPIENWEPSDASPAPLIENDNVFRSFYMSPPPSPLGEVIPLHSCYPSNRDYDEEDRPFQLVLSHAFQEEVLTNGDSSCSCSYYVIHKIGDYEPSLRKFIIQLPLIKDIPAHRWIDPVEPGLLLANRELMYKTIEQFLLTVHSTLVSLPPYQIVENIFAQDVSFDTPVIVKPIDASGDQASHQMLYLPPGQVLDKSMLKSQRVLVQEFIDHGEWVWKLYVIGEHVHITPNKSLLRPRKPVTFSSAELKKQLRMERENESIELPSLDKETSIILTNFALNICRFLGLSLLGVDIIIKKPEHDEKAKNSQPSFYVIDLNYFPGYNGVENLSILLAKCILNSIDVRN